MTVTTLANATIKDVARAMKQVTKKDTQLQSILREEIGHTPKTKRILTSLKHEMGDMFSHNGRLPEDELTRIQMDNPGFDIKTTPLAETMKKLFKNLSKEPRVSDISTYA